MDSQESSEELGPMEPSHIIDSFQLDIMSLVVVFFSFMLFILIQLGEVPKDIFTNEMDALAQHLSLSPSRHGDQGS